MSIVYPSDCLTDSEHNQFCHRFIEVLRFMRNAFGKWYREGLTLAQYNLLVDIVSHYIKICENPGANINTIIAAVKAKYPYKAQLTLVEWNAFVQNDYDPRREEIFALIEANKVALRNNIKWSKILTEP